MRILLDENLDWRLRRELPAHEVESVVQLGWAGIENGALLKKAVEARFELLVTMDGSMHTSKTSLAARLRSSRSGQIVTAWLTPVR